MVQVVYGGNDVFNVLAYGDKNPGTVQFLESQFQNFSHAVGDAGRAFLQSASDLYDRFNNAAAIQMAKAAARKVYAIFQPESIRPLWEVGAIQNAPRVMQRWIMAEPEIRTLFHQQRCDGYSDSYIDAQPGQVGVFHTDYRLVTNGMAMMGSEDDDYDFKITCYDTVQEDHEVALTFENKADILSTWDHVRAAIERRKEDPTSNLGGEL